jgi:hypothetical protein
MLYAQQLVVDVDERNNDIISGTIHFSFVVGDNFDPFSTSQASIYVVRDIEGNTLQVNSLLEAESSKVLGILVLHLSVENLVALGSSKSSAGDYNFSGDPPNDQGSSSPDIVSLPERVLGHRAGRKVEFCETWSGSNGDHCLETGRRK